MDGSRRKHGGEVHTAFCCTNQRERPIRRPTRIWEDNIKMDIQELGCGAWSGLIWLRIRTGGSCENGNEPSGSMKYG